MGKRHLTARSASSSRRGRSPISMASEAARDASPRPNSHPDRNLRPCKTMHPIGAKSQRRSQPRFPRFSLPPTPKERSVRRQANRWPKVDEANRNGNSRMPIRPGEKATTLLRLRRPSASLSQAVEDEAMLRVPAYNSKKEAFHHANSKCGLGLRIAPHNRVSGTGNKPLCKNCQKLNDQEAVNRSLP
jgi:hypothetical protein